MGQDRFREGFVNLNFLDMLVLKLFLLNYISFQFLEEFVKSQMLSRRLAYVCARRLMAMFNEACNTPRPHSPHNMGANSNG